jgi:hypothetical protein
VYFKLSYFVLLDELDFKNVIAFCGMSSGQLKKTTQGMCEILGSHSDESFGIFAHCSL